MKKKMPTTYTCIGPDHNQAVFNCIANLWDNNIIYSAAPRRMSRLTPFFFTNLNLHDVIERLSSKSTRHSPTAVFFSLWRFPG